MPRHPRYSKVQRGYRHDPDVAAFIAAVSKAANLPASHIVDECVKRQGLSVVTEILLRKALLRDKATIHTLARLLSKTP